MIELPQIFRNDTQGKDTYLVPLVVINNSIYLSTGKVTLENQHYDPLIKSLGKIKESIDIFEKKFKVSSVRMSFFNSEYNNERLLDRFFEGEIINSNVDVYYKSQSAITLNDCVKAYTGYVKNIVEESDYVFLEIEDRTEQVLGKEIPNKYTPAVDLPEKHRNKPIPIVYGHIDKAPVVYEKLINDSEYAVIADDFFLKSVDFPKIFKDDLYGNIKEEARLFEDIKGDTIYENADTSKQYVIENNKIIFQKAFNSTDSEWMLGLSGSPLSFNFAEVEAISDVYFRTSEHFQKGSAHATGDESDWWWVEGTTNVEAYSDLLGTVKQENMNGAYLMITDFSNMIHNEWNWGRNMGYIDAAIDNSTDPYTYEDLGNWHQDLFLFSNPFSDTWLNFEVDPFFSETSYLHKIAYKDDDDGDKEIESQISIEFSAEAEIHSVRPSANSPGHEFHGTKPALRLLWEKLNVELWTMKWDNSDVLPPVPEGGGDGWDAPYQVSVDKTGDNQVEWRTKKVNNNNFTVCNRAWYVIGDIGWQLIFAHPNWSEGVINWLHFNSFNFKRTVIMNEFNTYDLYADVTGRLDNQSLRYTQTGEPITSTAQGFQQPKQQVISPTSRPVRTTSKLPKTQRKKTSSGRSGGGGY